MILVRERRAAIQKDAVKGRAAHSIEAFCLASRVVETLALNWNAATIELKAVHSRTEIAVVARRVNTTASEQTKKLDT